VYNAAIAFTIDTGARRGQARLVFRDLVQHAPTWAQTAEHGIGLSWRILNLLSEGRCHLQEVRFPHVAVATEATYRRRFPADLIFRADHPSLAFSARDLNLAISERNQELHELATRYLDRQLPRGRTPFVLQIRQAIETLLGTGTCGYRQVANAVYMHPRTLQRRLREEGTTFEEIKDEVRRDLAERYLSQPDVPLTKVTALLDYSEQSALGRSCRRWFNVTPGEFRRELASA
jgi:AraC-like DNA-binding protein